VLRRRGRLPLRVEAEDPVPAREEEQAAARVFPSAEEKTQDLPPTPWRSSGRVEATV
jgi:hypothetical protein